jgi:hypothetical protein
MNPSKNLSLPGNGLYLPHDNLLDTGLARRQKPALNLDPAALPGVFSLSPK